MYQPIRPSIDPVPPCTNQCCPILTQYHQVSTSTNLYCCCLGITDFCTVYPGSCSFVFHEKAKRIQQGHLLEERQTVLCRSILFVVNCKIFSEINFICSPHMMRRRKSRTQIVSKDFLHVILFRRLIPHRIAAKLTGGRHLQGSNIICDRC